MCVLIIFSCIFWASALRIQPSKEDVKPTTIEDIDDMEWSMPGMAPVKVKDFNVSLVVYEEQDLISRQVKATGSWDGRDVKRMCNEFMKHGGKGNMLDIGANIGTYTLPLAACLKENGKGTNRIISIEGAPWNVKHFRAGMKINNLTNIHLYEYAIGSPDEVGTKNMIPKKGNQGMSHLSFHKKVPVPVTTIDTIAQIEGSPMQNILVMKIDIEGHEMKAFGGATNFFKNGPCMIWIEMKQAEDELTTFLQRHGYVVKQTGDHDRNAWCERVDLEHCIANLV